MEDRIAELADLMRSARRVTVLTGAGVSAASGVPTFRGSGGLWKSFSAHQLATPEAFRSDPRLVWEWYNWRREQLARCEPNAAHRVLAAWSERFPDFTLITQNVDGLHEKAGTKNVVRFHGSIWEVRCWENCPKSPVRWFDRTVPFTEIPPKCPHCGGILRPGIVWFGEGIDPDVMSRSHAATECDLFFAIGTSAQVYPAAGLVDTARARGAFTVEINPEASASSVELAIQSPAEEALPDIEQALTA